MSQVRIDPTFRRKVRRFEKAVEAYSWAGAQPPQDRPTIEIEYKKAKKDLLGYGRLKCHEIRKGVDG